MLSTTGLIIVLCLLILSISLVNLVRSTVGRNQFGSQLQVLADQNQELRSLFEFDEMTTAKSRQYLSKKVDQDRRTAPIGLLYIDLDRFKSVNEGHGNHVGDALLMEIAAQIGSCLDLPDFVARVAGDEFCVILQTADPKIIEEIAQRIVEKIADASVKSGALSVSRSASVGACILDPKQKLIDGMITADGALRRAKSQGGNRAQMADRDVLQNLAAQRLKPSIEQLKSGLEKGEVIYHVQPIYNLSAQYVTGVEALIRWRTPSGTILQPEHFLETMTTNYHLTLKPPLEAANRTAQLVSSIHPQMFCAFNISASFLERSDEINSAWIDRLLNGVPAHQMVFEIVESAVIQDPKGASRIVSALREAGVRVALDDFGTGFSNLSRLSCYTISLFIIVGYYVVLFNSVLFTLQCLAGANQSKDIIPVNH